jgi:hypothetical protein
MKQRCCDCRYFHQGDRDVCRRYPPIGVDSTQRRREWPHVEKWDWCGEWQTKPTEQDWKELQAAKALLGTVHGVTP